MEFEELIKREFACDIRVENKERGVVFPKDVFRETKWASFVLINKTVPVPRGSSSIENVIFTPYFSSTWVIALNITSGW
jgi:hypothetical protein